MHEVIVLGAGFDFEFVHILRKKMNVLKKDELSVEAGYTLFPYKGNSGPEYLGTWVITVQDSFVKLPSQLTAPVEQQQL